MTTIRCVHGSVAQKSYGSEKRFLVPPPSIQVTGPVRSRLDDQQAAYLRATTGAKGKANKTDELPTGSTVSMSVKSLHVAGTGKYKSFQLRLSLLNEEAHWKASSGDSEISLPSSFSSPSTWASFSSAPISIISKSSRKTAKPRNSTAQVLSGSHLTLYNRVNSQTAKTKYLYLSPSSGQLSVQNKTWSSFRIELLSRPPESDLAGAEEGSVTYGSTIVLIDDRTGARTCPLVVCKVDRGMLPHEDSNVYGPVGQLQKVALMRLAPSFSSALVEKNRDESDFKSPRYYLRASAAPLSTTSTTPFNGTVTDENSGEMFKVVDLVDESFLWTLVGISKFEFSFFDTRAIPRAQLCHDLLSPRSGGKITPFPIITSMPFYEPTQHTLAMTVQSF
ncbi:beta-trefoil, partial [Violaceomyces palustris]